MRLPSDVARHAVGALDEVDGRPLRVAVPAGSLLHLDQFAVEGHRTGVGAELSLALPRRRALDGSLSVGDTLTLVATYGSGLVRVTVLPLPGRLAAELTRGASSAGSAAEDVAGGSVVRIGSTLLNAVVAREDAGERAYVVAGLVEPDLLDDVAIDLLGTP